MTQLLIKAIKCLPTFMVHLTSSRMIKPIMITHKDPEIITPIKIPLEVLVSRVPRFSNELVLSVSSLGFILHASTEVICSPINASIPEPHLLLQFSGLTCDNDYSKDPGLDIDVQDFVYYQTSIEKI